MAAPVLRRKLVDSWLAEGLVKAWEGPVGTLAANGTFTALPDSAVPLVATGGMRMLAISMEQQMLKEYGNRVEVSSLGLHSTHKRRNEGVER